MFRRWWPGADVDEGELASEVDQIAAAGYKGVEIADVMDSVTYPVDPDKYGYGTPRWNHAVESVLSRADQDGLQVDLTLGAHWPAAVPGLDVDGPASSKELTYGLEVVRGSFSGAVPAATPRTYPDRTSVNGVITTTSKTATPSLVAVTAVRCVQDDCTAQPLSVDLSSRVDLTARVHDGQIAWTPPDAHAWVLLGSWMRGTAQRNDAPFGASAMLITDPESRVVDHFGAAGAQAMTKYFAGQLSPETQRLLRKTGGSLFEDSLELSHSQACTPDLRRADRPRARGRLDGHRRVRDARLPEPRRLAHDGRGQRSRRPPDRVGRDAPGRLRHRLRQPAGGHRPPGQRRVRCRCHQAGLAAAGCSYSYVTPGRSGCYPQARVEHQRLAPAPTR